MDPLTSRILDIAVRSGEGHVPSALSVLDIVRAVYGLKTEQDIFLLGKGHGCLALYVVLEELRLIPHRAVDEFCQASSELKGHPELRPEWGITATTGSLGHGLPIAVGMALAKQIGGESGRVIVLCGDGEMEEGSCWEAIGVAAHLRLSSLVLIVDNNGSSPNRIDDDGPASLAAKLTAFGWWVVQCDGHDEKELRAALGWGPTGGLPLAVVANTVKGHGIAEMEQSPAEWHHRRVTSEDVARWRVDAG